MSNESGGVPSALPRFAVTREISAIPPLPGPALRWLHYLRLAGEPRARLVTGQRRGVHTLHVAATHHADERMIAALGAWHPGDRRTTLRITDRARRRHRPRLRREAHLCVGHRIAVVVGDEGV